MQFYFSEPAGQPRSEPFTSSSLAWKALFDTGLPGTLVSRNESGVDRVYAIRHTDGHWESFKEEGS